MAFTCACMHGTSSTLYIQCKMPTPLDSEATAICNMHIGGFAEVAPPEKWHGCLGIEGKVTPASCMNTSVHYMHICCFRVLTPCMQETLRPFCFHPSQIDDQHHLGWVGFWNLSLVPELPKTDNQEPSVTCTLHEVSIFQSTPPLVHACVVCQKTCMHAFVCCPEAVTKTPLIRGNHVHPPSRIHHR